MGHKNTHNMDDYLNDFEEAAKDYAELGPLWAELVFPDDFEALKALYGRNQNDYNSDRDNDSDNHQNKHR